MQSEASVTLARHLIAACAVTVLSQAAARAETCRFTGSTSHGGKIVVRAETTEADGQITVDVTLALTIAALTSNVTYYGEEITTWARGEPNGIAINQRTLIDGAIKRQQWDVFRRRAGKFEAERVQGTQLADFRQRHPGFAAHWAPATFGQPWLRDYAAAAAERRPDLDLPAGPNATQIRTPLAFAFYWSRFLPPSGEPVTLILPGFKHDLTASLRIAPAKPGEGWNQWSTTLVHPGLETSPSSLAAAWVSPQNYLLQLGFELHTSWASGTVLLHTEGCQGVQIHP